MVNQPMGEETPERSHNSKYQTHCDNLLTGADSKCRRIDTDVVGAIRQSYKRYCRGSRVCPSAIMRLRAGFRLHTIASQIKKSLRTEANRENTKQTDVGARNHER